MRKRNFRSLIVGFVHKYLEFSTEEFWTTAQAPFNIGVLSHTCKFAHVLYSTEDKKNPVIVLWHIGDVRHINIVLVKTFVFRKEHKFLDCSKMSFGALIPVLFTKFLSFVFSARVLSTILKVCINNFTASIWPGLDFKSMSKFPGSRFKKCAVKAYFWKCLLPRQISKFFWEIFWLVSSECSTTNQFRCLRMYTKAQ